MVETKTEAPKAIKQLRVAMIPGGKFQIRPGTDAVRFGASGTVTLNDETAVIKTWEDDKIEGVFDPRANKGGKLTVTAGQNVYRAEL